MVAHAPSRCPKITENHWFILQEYKSKLQEKCAQLYDVADSSGPQLSGRISDRICRIQSKLRVAVLSAHDDERSDKKIRRNVERIKKEKEKKHHQYLNEIKEHHQIFQRHHRECHKLRKRLASQAVQWHHRQEKQDLDGELKAERDRIKALKEHDEETYMRLLANTKNERIKKMVAQTDEFMNELASKVEASRPDHQEKVIAGADDQDLYGLKMNNENYNNCTHRIQERILKQPAMMDKAGTMREYQLNGLQWMASLYNNGLNGILADEMGLGKTIQSVSLIGFIKTFKDPNSHHMVIVPKAVIKNWEREIEKFCPQLKSVLIIGTKEDRQRTIDEELLPGDWDVVITTYEVCILEKTTFKKFHWRYIID